ncbi:hypothetical protein D3C81_1818890 [compost metagenome]
MHVLAGDRQVFELCQNMTADLRQHLWLIGTDIKHLLIFLGFKGVEAHRKHRQFSRATGRFKQPIRVGVIACGGIGFDISDAGNVIVIVRVTPVVMHIVIFNAFVIKFAEDLLRRLAKFDTQMVDQL